MPFIEALAQMPKYAKFLKRLLTNKAKHEEACKITMNKRCSVGEPKATRMSLELLDRSIQYPRGIIKHVLIKVDKFVLLIDFVILDMPEDSRVPIISGRPFLATARAKIDVFNKKITLTVGDDEVIFNVDQLIKRPTTKDDGCYGIDDLDDTINKEAQELLANEEPDSFLSKTRENHLSHQTYKYSESAEKNNDDGFSNSKKLDTERNNTVNSPKQLHRKQHKLDKFKSEHLYSASANEIDEKKPELKNLPQHLEYAYLHRDKSFPIIISSKLSEKEKMSLLQVLEKRKRHRLENDSSKFQSLWKIKKRQPSPVLMGLLLTDECRLDYAMLLLLFKDA
ncbi:DNA-directed DNA polymerase [Tanacetum coccineum]